MGIRQNIEYHPVNKSNHKNTWSRGNLMMRMFTSLVKFALLLGLIVGLTACQNGGEETSSSNGGQVQEDTPIVSEPTAEGGGEPEPVPTEEEDLQVVWQRGKHADTFVLDDSGKNMTCARCHSPVNWLPSIDDVPETCLACKFEIEDPPPLVSESEWGHIPCKTCHEVDKNGEVEADFIWLEIAAIDEYAKVETTTELCQKCHVETDVPDHLVMSLGGAHADYLCTDCHNAHDTSATCGAVGCHDDVIEPATPIAGHDEQHQEVTCGACHDGSGMDIGPDDEQGMWLTFITGTQKPIYTHNVVLEAKCDRCHYTDNPWGLSGDVSLP
jgi:hypothetical protein